MPIKDRNPVWTAITTDPETAPIPKSKMACAMHTAALVERMTEETMPAVMQYVRRMDEEWQFMFAALVTRDTDKWRIAYDSDAFCRWVIDHEKDL
jgi:hypothetical protein